jgi:hypothetical protein
MAGRGTRRDAFAYYGITLGNPNWSISGISTDGQPMVAVSLWRDELRTENGRQIYDRPSWGDWSPHARPSLFEHLTYARDDCDGIVRVVISVRDRDASGKVKTSDCYPQPKLLLRITRLDLVSGGFRLEQVESEDRSPLLRNS